MLKVPVTLSRWCTNRNTLSKMADAGDDLSLFGDDFEASLDLLDEDEALQEQFSTVASEVSANYINIHLHLVCF